MLPARSGRPTGLQILHLEDDPLDAKLIATVLHGHLPCRVTTVTNRAALEAELGPPPPDVILSDSSLPGFDGLAALALAKQKFPHVPFIFCSGHVSPKRKAEALKQGAADYLFKEELGTLVMLVQRLCHAPDGRPDATSAPRE